MIFLFSTDSAWANCRSGHSQAGRLSGATSRSIASGADCDISPLVWESAKLQRVCPSTLATEAMVMSKGMAETTFVEELWNEMSDGVFDLHRWLEKHPEADS